MGGVQDDSGLGIAVDFHEIHISPVFMVNLMLISQLQFLIWYQWK